ncbi:MAG: hypothetical protein WC444_06030 [Candidatus Paceibacterota bacterium]
METKEIKCGACGHIGINIGACASECSKCHASVDPNTGEPFMVDGRIVYSWQFGGIDF